MAAATPAGLPAEAQAWVDRLGLEPLEHEGGMFRQMYLDEHSSAITYLLAAPDFSALHSLGSTEVYHWYAGSALLLTTIAPNGEVVEHRLGPDHAAGELPQAVVPPGVMQGSSPAGEWCLVGTTMSPPFDWASFVLGDRELLSRRSPEHADRIAALTRPEPSPR